MIHRLYLDVCVYCRPVDDQTAMRVRLETDAYYLIMRHLLNGRYRSVVSPVHFKEIRAITSLEERTKVQSWLTQSEKPQLTPNELAKIRQRAEELYALNFGSADAAHVAFAEQLADVFLTCDDKLLKKCQNTPLSISTMNPLEWLLKEDLQ